MSFDVTNGDLLKATAETKKTLLMSISMASAKEICDSYQLIKSFTDKVALLHCVSSYPLNVNDANLICIQSLKKKIRLHNWLFEITQTALKYQLLHMQLGRK